MDEALTLELGHDAIITLIKVAAPIMMVALFVGLIISLFQALTQIQEMTLSFVPKILAIFVAMLIFMPYILNTLTEFNERIFERIATIE